MQIEIRRIAAVSLRAIAIRLLMSYHLEMDQQPKKRGRKPLHPGEPMSREIATLTPMQKRMAVALGGGNFSAGVRLAIEAEYERYQRRKD